MNLENLRNGLLGFTVVILGLGYAASQWFYFQGRSSEYARIVDIPSIRGLALVVLLLYVALALAPEKTEAKAS